MDMDIKWYDPRLWALLAIMYSARAVQKVKRILKREKQ
jgi:hypothetical protein